jgi:HlyD family secretion protein
MTTRSRRGRRALWVVLPILALLAIVGWRVYSRSLAPASHPVAASTSSPRAAPRGVTALGRLKPKGGVVRVAGPSYFAVVLSRLQVEEGDRVRAGQILAVLDTFEPLKANLARVGAALANAERQDRKLERLHQEHIVSDAQRDDSRTQLEVARADVARARADLEQAVVRSPIAGRVLKVHARSGERVGDQGIAEIGRTDAMRAVAEVYETDIARIRVGQRATIASPALPHPIGGTVERIGDLVGKLDILGTDPVARTDARVVEVEIKLDDSATVAGMTNLQVEIAFDPLGR